MVNKAFLKHLTKDFEIVRACGKDAAEFYRDSYARGWATGGELGVLIPMTFDMFHFEDKGVCQIYIDWSAHAVEGVLTH